VTQKYAKNTNNNIRLQQNVVAGHKLPAVLLSNTFLLVEYKKKKVVIPTTNLPTLKI
jgi:hypothetical protein